MLFGCGSESDTSTQPTSVTIEAHNFAVGVATTTTPVDLSALNTVTVSDNSNFIVTGVEVLSNSDECESVTTDGTAFTVHNVKSSNLVCDYRYAVDSPSGELTSHSRTSGIGRVVLNSRSTAVPQEMIPVSTIVQTGKSTVIDLAAALSDVGEDVSGLALSTTTSHAYPNHGTVTSVNTTDQTLSYTAPTSNVIDRVMFSYTSADTTKLGYLDIAVSGSVNLGLKILPQNKYDTYITAGGDKITIDIAKYVCIPDGTKESCSNNEGDYDGRGFFIEQLSSFYADVEIVTGTSKFTFKSSRVGYHYVSFAVADGDGAFEIGLLRVAVVDQDQIKNWPDLQVGLSLFSAPLTTLEASLKEPKVINTGSVEDTGYSPAAIVATFYPSGMAKQYCENGLGRLPESDELVNLANFNAKSKGDWPVSFPYLAADDDGAGGVVYSLVDLTDGSKSSYTISAEYIISCIKPGMLAVEVLEDNADPWGGDKNTLKFTVYKNGVSGPDYKNPYAGVTITPVLSSTHGEHSHEVPPGSSAEMDFVSYTTDANGEFIVNLTSDAPEVTYVTVTMTENGVTESITGTVWFGPFRTMHLSSLVIDQDDGNSLEPTDSQSKITQLTGKVQDDTNTAYQYQSLKVYSQELWNIDGKSQVWVGDIASVATADEIVDGVPIIVTDSNGESTISVSNYGGLMKQVEITMEYEPPLGNTYGVTTKTETVSFCAENSMPIPTMESGGKLFTANPMEWVVRSCGISYGSSGSGFSHEECGRGIISGTSNTNVGQTPEDRPDADFNTGPCGVSFARFQHRKESTPYCASLAAIGHAGRTDWRLPTQQELLNLYNDVGKDAFLAAGWPLFYYYLHNSTGSRQYAVRLFNGATHQVTDNNANGNYVSCVSDAP